MFLQLNLQNIQLDITLYIENLKNQNKFQFHKMPNIVLFKHSQLNYLDIESHMTVLSYLCSNFMGMR